MSAFDPVLDRIRRLPPVVVDGAIAAAIVVFEGIEILGPDEPKRAAQIALLVLGGIGVTLRRKNPWLAFCIVQAAAVVGLFTNVLFMTMHGGMFEEYVVLFTVSVRRTTRASIGALVGILAVDYIGWHIQNSMNPIPTFSGGVSEWNFLAWVLSDYLWYVLVLLVGWAEKRRRWLAFQLEQSAAALTEERERLAVWAVASERDRIALDLHALVVRGVEKMSLQIRAAQNQLESDGAEALETIVAIEGRGRDTLVQMRRLLSVLRSEPEAGHE